MESHFKNNFYACIQYPFLGTQNQSTQPRQSTAFCWEIFSIEANLFGFPTFFEIFFFLIFKGCDGEVDRMKEDNSLCVMVDIPVSPGFLFTNLPELHT